MSTLTDGPATAAPPPAHQPPPPPPPMQRSRAGRLFLGATGDPRWARPALWGLLAVTAVLYLWNLSASGDANDFYAAAVKAGTEDVKAWLFASLDPANAITVDKPPASIWLMALSGRIFGFSSWSMLIPQALLGVGTVALVWAAVRRWSGDAAGLIAGTLVTLTPVAALMFRFNNPDALLVFLMTLAAYFVARAIETERGRTAVRWLLLAGVALGFAFLTKMLQGLIVLPAFALAYLVAGRAGWWTRVWHLLAAGGALIVSAGWYVLLVSLWPADSRPYIGGSTDNSLWQLAIGYNGLARIFGRESAAADGGAGGAGAGGVGGAGGGFGGNGGFGGSTGLGRMFGSSFGTEISWLLPAALIGLLAGLWFTRRFPRTDRIRAGLILWGGAMVVSALVFSFMAGTVHPYYAVAMAPFVAATVAISGRELWRGRSNHVVRAILALMIATTGAWSFVLLSRDSSWLPWLRWIVLVGSLLGAALLVVSAGAWRRFAVVGLLVGSLTALSGAAAWTVATAATAHSGSIPTSGPAGSSAGGFGAAAGRAGFGGGARPDRATTGSQETTPDGSAAGAAGDGQAPAEGTAGGTGQAGTGVIPPAGSAGGGFGGGGTTVSADLINLLNATATRWSAAVSGAQSAAPYILNTHTAVMAIGGFSGDPYPTLEQFQQYVADGDISYYIAGGGLGGGRGGTNSAIEEWVQSTFTSSTVGGVTVYDLRSTS
ncbi:ArnT family glycosyltransferase [Nakamurella sp.]|uniref:ArnT family glycosyltransferase n=1 Tax=Nakamurella sp. TaxID=1869182 RepID=UPI003783BBC6